MSCQKEHSRLQQEEKKRILRRDVTFILLGAIAASVLGWMELHAGDAEYRGEDAAASVDVQRGIIDTGYILTKPLHDFLRDNRGWNDFFAFINTVIGVGGPSIYLVHQTCWVGDYEPIFRYLAISVLRSMCGWFTYLPPDDSYLMSNYDFPDIIQCLIKECEDPTTAELHPFVSFFSGHVATLVICANHMYFRGNKKLSIFLHGFNVFQIVRLLATRGHYSIDIIIGFLMAKYISNPAGRMGRHFSKSDNSFVEAMPVSATEVFEDFIGVNATRTEKRMSEILKLEDVKRALSKYNEEQERRSREEFAEPSMKMAWEGKLDELVYIETETRSQTIVKHKAQ